MMAPTTYTSFLVGYGLLAAALLAGLYLFFTLKRDIEIAARKQQQRVEAIAKRLRFAEEPLLLEAPMDDHLPAIAYPSDSSRVRAGFNLNKRVQTMRLLRRGEDVSHIAAVLAVPRREVELLIRVQQMTAFTPLNLAPKDLTQRTSSAAAGAGAELSGATGGPTGYLQK
jgi:hypothetical protein